MAGIVTIEDYQYTKQFFYTLVESIGTPFEFTEEAKEQLILIAEYLSERYLVEINFGALYENIQKSLQSVDRSDRFAKIKGLVEELERETKAKSAATDSPSFYNMEQGNFAIIDLGRELTPTEPSTPDCYVGTTTSEIQHLGVPDKQAISEALRRAGYYDVEVITRTNGPQAVPNGDMDEDAQIALARALSLEEFSGDKENRSDEQVFEEPTATEPAVAAAEVDANGGRDYGPMGRPPQPTQVYIEEFRELGTDERSLALQRNHVEGVIKNPYIREELLRTYLDHYLKSIKNTGENVAGVIEDLCLLVVGDRNMEILTDVAEKYVENSQSQAGYGRF